MSRVGNKPIALPDGVSVSRKGDVVEVKGPKGTLSEAVPPAISMDVSDGTVTFKRADEKKESRAMHGLARALVNNMVQGVVTPFVKELEIQGVGYRADVSGSNLNLNVGTTRKSMATVSTI